MMPNSPRPRETSTQADKAGPKRPRFVRFVDTDGRHRWHLKAGNGEVLAVSAEGFARKSGVTRSIARMKAAADEAAILG